MKQKDVLITVILLFIFTLAWIGESIYRSTVNSTISETVNQDIKSINPNFDTKTVNKLRLRKKIIPSFDIKIVTPAPIVMPTLPYSPNSSGEAKLKLLK
jgi:hypothetical protein